MQARHSKIGAVIALFLVLAVIGKIGQACGVIDDTPSTSDTPSYTPSYTPDTPDTHDPDVQRVALDVTWDRMSYTEQQEMCQAVDMFGYESAAAQINGGADYTFDADTIEDWLRLHC